MREGFQFEGKRLVVDEVHTQEGFYSFMGSLNLKAPFIVKPNWICGDYAHFTDPQILEWTLRFLHSQGEVVLVESYSARNSMFADLSKPCLRVSKDERTRLRESEKNFLKRTGIRDVIEDFEIEYVNITEEVLDEKIVSQETVKRLVESRYPPVLRDELYCFVPTKLYALRRGTFINLAKFKVFFTMCTKNMFGLIPEHVGYGSRYDTYHGEADKDLSRNIVDINKIYRSIFNVAGLVEGINSLSYNIGSERGNHKSAFGYRYDVLEGKGLLYYCDDPLWLDAFVHQQCEKAPLESDHLQLASRAFRRWPPEVIKRAREEGHPLQ